MSRRSLTLLSAVLAVSALAAAPSAAQQGGPLQPPTTGGLPVLLQELKMLGHNKRVLMIGAHPDDEDTQLLVMLTRREGAEAAYLALNRGEGGQNLIGTELGEALGILRTEELLAARNVDGAQQFFTRAYDFGFSKTLDDTWAHWPKDSVLKDVVRIVRRFRPQIIVSVFSGTPRDGHGQHQAAGWAAQEAYRVAGDPTRFPELKTEEGLDPWTPTKLYIEAWFNPTAATLTVDGGEVEPLSGRTYHQLAMAARSLHRSQDMGNLQDFGPSPSRLTFKAARGATADPGDGWPAFWSGVDTVLQAPQAHFATLAAARAEAGRDRSAVAAALARAAEALPADGTPDYAAHLRRARQIVSWIFGDAVAERSALAPGDVLRVALLARNASGTDQAGIGWTLGLGRNGANLTSEPVTLGAGENVSRSASLAIPDTLTPTTPYYLRLPRQGDLYNWAGTPPAMWGIPKDPDEVVARLGPMATREAGLPGSFSFPVRVSSRFRDQSFGEVRTPVVIVPRIDVKLTPGNAVIRSAATGEARIVTVDVTLEHGASDTASGSVGLDLQAGWPKVAPVPFTLDGAGAQFHATFRMAVPPDVRPGTYRFGAYATDANGKRYTVGAFTVDYPHIRPRQYTRLALGQVEVVELTPPAVRRVGYVRGAADKVPEALAAAGMPVTILDSAALTSGDLHQYDVIVIGPRAYEVDSAVVRNSPRLIDYARDGGRVVVQYQQQIYLEGHYAPFALGGNSRITDEHSPVTMLSASPSQSALAPVFNSPNTIGPSDWEGWIQERALYCPTTWGPEFHPLLAMNDPGEAPLRGCLIEGTVGRGTYVYTGISFFRELPAGVPGAYRLFFNLLGGRATP